MIDGINTIGHDALNSIQMILYDFDGVFTNNSVYVDQNGVETVQCSRSDGIGLARLRDLGIIMCIVSTEQNPVVSVRAKKLKLDCYQGVSDKAKAVRQICLKQNISTENVMFVGNDINDIPAFDLVGFPVGVQDSFDEVRPHISFITANTGGNGAVREICDVLYFHKKILGI